MTLYDCLVFYATFNKFSIISQRFLVKLPVLLVHLSWHLQDSHYANPETLKADITTIFKVFDLIRAEIEPTTSRTRDGRITTTPIRKYLYIMTLLSK